MRRKQKLGLIAVKNNSDIQKVRRNMKLERRRKAKEAWCNPINFFSLKGAKMMFKGYKTDEQIKARYKKFKAKRPA